VVCRNPVVVEPQERDDVFDVCLARDVTRSRPDLPGEDRMLGDPLLFEQLGPHILREAEVRGVIAVQVADLAPVDRKGELASSTRTRLHTGPGGDFRCDLLARCLPLVHAFLLDSLPDTEDTSSSELEVKQRVGLSLEEIGAELASLPADRAPTRRDWSRLSHGWRARIDERIAELERLRVGLTECIGCGCLSLDRCKLANPSDRAGRLGPGPRYWLGDRASTS